MLGCTGVWGVGFTDVVLGCAGVYGRCIIVFESNDVKGWKAKERCVVEGGRFE